MLGLCYIYVCIVYAGEVTFI